ncbi:hypothetical protein P7C70_g2197, partial [Phenoliferia sp. Uapishka_3]
MKEVPFFGAFTTTQQLVGYDKKWKLCGRQSVDFPTKSAPNTSALWRAKLTLHPSLQLYTLQTFTSTSDSSIVYCTLLSHIVLKINRRTVPPARALALAGYAVDGDSKQGNANWEIVKKMSKKERLTWLFASDDVKLDKGSDVIVGNVESGMERRSEWPGAL